MIAVQVLTTLAALIVGARALSVVNGMVHRERGRQPLWAWIGFGFSYIALAMGAAGSLIVIWDQPLPELYLRLGYGVIVAGSAGLILCDRRRRDRKLNQADRAAIAMIIDGKHRASNDPQEIVQWDTFAEVCEFRGPPLMGTRFCRHPERGLGACGESACPRMRAAMKAGPAVAKGTP